MLAISNYMKQDVVSKKLEEILGKNAQSFVSSALQAISSNSLLEKAEPASVYRSVMAGAVMGLPLNQNIGHAYLVPYNNRKTGNCEAQLQIGYKGFIQLAIRSKQFKTINTTEIYKNQYEGEDYITGEVKIKNEKGKGAVVGYLAYFELLNGFKKWLYMDTTTIEKHAKKYSQSYKKGFGVWADGEDGFNSMAKKTVLKLLLSRFAPLSIEMQTAIETDQGVVNDNGIDYVDNDKTEEKTAEEKKEIVETKKEEMKKAQKENGKPEKLI